MTTISAKNLKRDEMLGDKRVDPVFRRKAVAVLSDVRGHGIPLVVVEVYRDKIRAALMKTLGKSKVGAKSKHCLGLAADMAFDDGKGGITWNVSDVWWDAYGSACRAHSLVWGGDWQSFIDKNHCELD
jgi:hypothetical protein